MSANRWEAEQETKERAHNNAVREIARSRHWTKEYLTEAEVEGVPPLQTIINPMPPAPGLLNGRFDYQPPSWADSLRGLHAAMLEFWTEVKPYRERISTDWSETTVTVQVPKQGEWKRRQQQFNQEFEQRGVILSWAEVTMEDLAEQWRFQSISLACREDGQVTTRQEKIYLPPAACRTFYEELNAALLELGLLAEVREIEGHATDPGVPDDIEDWGVDNGDGE